MAKLDKSAVREHVHSLDENEIANLIFDINTELRSRGNYMDIVAYLNLAYHSMTKES